MSFSRPTGDGVFDNMAPNNPVKLENVQFEFDKSILMPSSLVSLDSLARYIKLHVDLKFLITGHTDIIGGEKYNLKLSEDRAKSVLNYLLIKGIAADRLTATGKGNSEPISGNRTDTERELNRRVTITLIEN